MKDNACRKVMGGNNDKSSRDEKRKAKSNRRKMIVTLLRNRCPFCRLRCRLSPFFSFSCCHSPIFFSPSYFCRRHGAQCACECSSHCVSRKVPFYCHFYAVIKINIGMRRPKILQPATKFVRKKCGKHSIVFSHLFFTSFHIFYYSHQLWSGLRQLCFVVLSPFAVFL